jgi:hypothetical protein
MTSLRERTITSRPSVAAPLHTYRLKFSDDGRGLQKDVEFEAEDAAEALMIAHKEASNRWAELWRDGRKLCTIQRTEQGVWELQASRPQELGR